MPYVDLTIPDAGTFSFRYSISTPSSKTADAIVPHLPCILFLHSDYTSQVTFELQFSDVFLRQFNLIAIDMRGHGETLGMIKEGRYTPTESANDVEQIMTKLALPPCHLFGLSNGCTVALELAISRPDLVLSLFLCSPLPPVEPEEILAGRLQIWEYWKQIEESKNAHNQLETVSEELIDEVFIGASQLLFNNIKSNAVQALSHFEMDFAKRNWSGSPEKLRHGYKSSFEWIVDRRQDIDKSYDKIKAPVSIIHCAEDIAYPVKYAEELESAFREAQVARVTLYKVQGTHLGNVTNPQQINKIIYQGVISYHPELFPGASYALEEAAHHKLPTPWTDSLIECHGYEPLDDPY